ncbi:MAG: hypothetical protein M3O30_03995 [Planctomycetota bacterium]|nr:hypothetical protein [Planctomycetota bacterium]
MTVLWWSKWAAEPEMTPLLNQALSQDDMAQMTASLDSKGIAHSVVGDRLMVPADRKMEILGELGFSQALPKDFNNAFEDLVLKQSNWLDPPDKTDRLYLEAKNRTLAQLISHFPGVSNAAVIIDPTTERSLDNAAIQPRATINITTGGRGIKSSAKQLAESAADLVSGAQAGLLRSQIVVIVDGVGIAIKDPGQDGLDGSDSVVEAQRKAEDAFRDKVLEHYSDIPGLLVSVSVKLNTSTKEEKKHAVDPKSIVSMATSTEDRNQETVPGSPGGQEPGASANVGLSVGSSAGSGGGSSTTNDAKSSFENDHTTTDDLIRQGPGEATVVSASVRVPRSHFINDLKRITGKDPDEASLESHMSTEIAKIRKEVVACTGIGSEDQVVVSDYADAPPQDVAAMVPTSALPVPMSLIKYSKEIGVGLLAGISLFMVSMMVRKGVPAPIITLPMETSEPTRIGGGEPVAGEVGEGNAMLDAVELDDGAVKSQQMLDQVQQMVQSNPDAAANLVKRWLNRV